MFRTCLILGILFFVSCDSQPNAKVNDDFEKSASDDITSDFVLIASIAGNDQATQMKVTRLLNSHSIDCFFEGSVTYGLFVRSSDATTVASILANTPDLDDNQIRVADRFK